MNQFKIRDKSGKFLTINRDFVASFHTDTVVIEGICAKTGNNIEREYYYLKVNLVSGEVKCRVDTENDLKKLYEEFSSLITQDDGDSFAVSFFDVSNSLEVDVYNND